ncbi:hypothetical protein [Peribacillus butanolivorans]|uniref:hypothetical protein n=1 Tax=Peribacillus butanolivorans TaxID=421767 RepID=UPI00382B446F
MEKLKSKLSDILEKSPLFETLIFAGSVIFSGILTGAFINELTVNNEIQWKNAFKIVPTYLILIYLVILYHYNKFLYNERLEINNFKDDVFLSAYVKKELVPEIVTDFKKNIREGTEVDFKKFDDLIDIKSLMNNQNSGKGQDNT